MAGDERFAQLARRGVQDWLDEAGLRRHSGESAVDFGQRVYTYFRTHGAYTYPPSSAWNSAACSRRLRTDCGGFSLVFVGACRANHIPARLLVGQCFKVRRAGDGMALTGGRQAHVIAEFYDPPIGWIPEDISSQFLHVGGFSDLNFFGRDPGYFFAWQYGHRFLFRYAAQGGCACAVDPESESLVQRGCGRSE